MFWRKKPKKISIKVECSTPMATILEELTLESELEEAIASGTIGEGLERLLERGDYRDAVRVVVQSFQRNDAVNWALDCLHEVNPSSVSTPLLSHAREWVKTPNTQARQKVIDHLPKDQVNDSKTWIGLAIFFSEGPLSFVAGEPGPDPEPSLFGKAISGAVMLAATLEGEEEVAEKMVASRYDRFFQLAANRIQALKGSRS